MAINQNHLFEEINGVRCAIVEKNASQARVDFLRGILEYNGYTVVVVGSPPPKAAPAPAGAGAAANAAAAGGNVAGAGGAAGSDASAAGMGSSMVGIEAVPPVVAPPVVTPPATFTVAVTDVTFNPTNAIFGRLLKAPGGHVVTLAYWQQKENRPHDEVPYFEK